MKIVCVGDAYVTAMMMEEGVKPCLTEDDTLDVLFFGEENRIDMRDTVKAIESMKRDIIPVPSELESLIEDCEILIVHLCPVTRKLIEKAKASKHVDAILYLTENKDKIKDQFSEMYKNSF